MTKRNNYLIKINMFQRSNEEGLSGYENQAWSLDNLHKDSPTQEEVTCRIKMAQKSSK